MSLPLLIVILVVVIGAIVLIVIGLRSPQNKDPLQDRLSDYVSRGETASLEEIELSQPFVERVLYPFARRFGELALRFAPQNAIQQVAKKLDMAGNPGRIDPTIFFAFRFLGILLGLVVLFLGKILPNSLFGTKGLLIAIPASILGFYLPDLLLKAKIDRRQDAIRKAMPDALDLLTICVEAGLGFDSAMAKVYEKWDNELARAFGRVIREIQLGKVRKDAMKDMAERLGVAEMTGFVAAVSVSMSQVLRIQADQMRIRRRQLAEEKAHQAPIKMLIPMGIFIFPSICIVLMTPAILILIKSNAGAVFSGG
jgi:tight adherence protein C